MFWLKKLISYGIQDDAFQHRWYFWPMLGIGCNSFWFGVKRSRIMMKGAWEKRPVLAGYWIVGLIWLPSLWRILKQETWYDGPMLHRQFGPFFL